MTDWKDISTAPKDGRLVILGWDLNTDEPVVIGGWFERGVNDRCWYGIDHDQAFPTHWMPLPAPPKEM